MVEPVIAEARARGEVTVPDTREAAAVGRGAAGGPGAVRQALQPDPRLLGDLWANCLALLGAHAPSEALAG